MLGEGERWWAYRFGLAVPDGIARAPWTDERIRRLLDLYLARKTTWPSYGQFERDGMYALRQAIIASGGVKRWSAEFPSVGPVQKRSACAPWSAARIRAELPALLTHGVFPARRAFIQADQESLYNAICTHGGIAHWAHTFGLPTADEARRAARNAPRAPKPSVPGEDLDALAT